LIRRLLCCSFSGRSFETFRLLFDFLKLLFYAFLNILKPAALLFHIGLHFLDSTNFLQEFVAQQSYFGSEGAKLISHGRLPFFEGAVVLTELPKPGLGVLQFS
jgi:hypothetical protein